MKGNRKGIIDGTGMGHGGCFSLVMNLSLLFLSHYHPTHRRRILEKLKQRD
jgi:hypothetical protein